MAPIIHKLAKDGTDKVMVLCLNPTHDISNDYRLAFLSKSCGVTVEYIYSSYCPTMAHRLIGAIIKSRYFQGSSKRKMRSLFRGGSEGGFLSGIGYLVAGVFKKYFFWGLFNGRFKRNYYNREWVEGLLRKNEPTLMVFDHGARPGLFVIDELQELAKEWAVPTAALPHAILLFSGDHPYVQRAYTNETLKGMDRIIVIYPQWKKNFVERGFKEDQLRVLGSARYCREWRELLSKISTPQSVETKSSTGKVKVLYMERQADRHGEFKGLVQDTVERLAAMASVDLLIQPSTRSNRIYFDAKTNLSDNISFADTLSLCEWADVVICLSSVSIEILLRGKVLINARYLHGQEILLEKYGVGWLINSFEELEAALEKLKDEPAYRPYSAESVERFIDEFVYGGKPERDVLEEYNEYLSHMNTKRITGERWPKL